MANDIDLLQDAESNGVKVGRAHISDEHPTGPAFVRELKIFAYFGDLKDLLLLVFVALFTVEETLPAI